jgi:hypothetical protein
MSKKQIAALVNELAASDLSDKDVFARIMDALPSRRWGRTYQAVLDARSK